MAFIVRVPFAEGSLEKNLGCEEAPTQILGHLSGLRLNTESIEVVNSNLEETQNKIMKNAKAHFEKKEKCLFLGGDHSITYPIFKAFAETYENAGMVLVDAHADCYQYVKPSSHEDYICILVKDGLLKPENILMLGTRHIWPEEEKFIAEKKIKFFNPKKIQKGEAIEELIKFAGRIDNIYLSIDIDALDSKIAPATGYPEKNGLQLSELAEIIEILKESGKVKGADLVEINPKMEGGGGTVKVGAEIAKQLLSFL